ARDRSLSLLQGITLRFPPKPPDERSLPAMSPRRRDPAHEVPQLLAGALHPGGDTANGEGDLGNVVIDVLCPVLGRPWNVQPLVESLKVTQTPHRLYFICSPGDSAQIAACEQTDAETWIVDW